MPRSAPRPCTHPGCGRLAPIGSRCAEHPYWQDTDKHRPNSAQRGYSGRWLRLRKMALARDPMCRICQRAPSTDVDHIVPRSQGGEDALHNLQGLCHACHSRKTARYDGGFGG